MDRSHWSCGFSASFRLQRFHF